MNTIDHFSESLETVFGLIRDLFDLGSGMKKFGSGNRDKHSGSSKLVITLF
jgi:hypothetical protein